MKYQFFILLSIAFGTIALTSCEKKGQDSPEIFEGIYYQEGTTDREYFETVANTVLGFVKPQSQKEAITALNVFANYCDQYAFPENFNGDPDMSRTVADLADNIENCDFAGISRALITYAFSYANLTGLYQADTYDRSWHFIENRDNLDFKFYNGTREYNVIMTGLGGTWSTIYEASDIKISLEVPKVIDIVVTTGANTATTTLISAKIQSEFKDGSSLILKSSIRFADIQLESTINATNSKIANDITVYEHDPQSYVRTLLMQSTATINGSNLCSVNAWRDMSQSADPEQQLARMFGDASVTIMIYKSVQLKSAIKNLQTVLENGDGYWSTEDVADPKAAADKAAKALQGCVTTELRYCSDYNDKVRGTLGWQPYVCDDWYGGETWAVRPTLTFISDGATYDFSSFFGQKRFQTIENTVNNVIRSYRAFWQL